MVQHTTTNTHVTTSCPACIHNNLLVSLTIHFSIFFMCNYETNFETFKSFYADNSVWFWFFAFDQILLLSFKWNIYTLSWFFRIFLIKGCSGIFTLQLNTIHTSFTTYVIKHPDLNVVINQLKFDTYNNDLSYYINPCIQQIIMNTGRTWSCYMCVRWKISSFFYRKLSHDIAELFVESGVKHHNL
jgi:hypothetical protein